MGAYSLESVIQKWEQGKLTTEQAIGQLLLLVQSLSARVGVLEQQGKRPFTGPQQPDSVD